MSKSLAGLLVALASPFLVHVQQLGYQSPYFRVEMAGDQPNFSVMAVDSLGKGKLDLNVMLPLRKPDVAAMGIQHGSAIEYPGWAFEFGDRRISIRTVYETHKPNVTAWRVLQSDEPPNYRWDGALQEIEGTRKTRHLMLGVPGTPMPDITITDHGSVVLLNVISRRAEAWITQHVQSEGWQWLGRSLGVEPRLVNDFVAAMVQARLTVELPR